MVNFIEVAKRKYASFTYKAALRGFSFFERLGVHVTPVHFYSPVPDTRHYDSTLFSREMSLEGVRMDVDGQLATLDEVFPRYIAEYVPQRNTGLSLVDAYVLYVLIRVHKPLVMIEIGAGESTRISLQALEKNRSEGTDYRFIAVEPYPGEVVRGIDNPRFELVAEKVENLPLAFFAEADMLFIDSSHVSRIGSDVNYEILEIVPSLKKGAMIHWHDIAIPTNYWEDWAKDGNKFWNESYLLHAFLQFNDSFRIMWASRYMALKHGDAMKRCLPFMAGDERCSSFWLAREK